MRLLKEKVSITLDSDVIEMIKSLSEADERSFSQYINLILKQHINKVESKNLERKERLFMADYKKLYFSLFNYLSEIKDCIEKGDFETAAVKVEIAQFASEDEYIEQ